MKICIRHCMVKTASNFANPKWRSTWDSARCKQSDGFRPAAQTTMSEYQYYEFQTVDDRLSEMEMEELRRYSTRARITPTGFTNEYNYGNFKGNADAWMEKYFDGFLYLANWGTRELQLAVPGKLLAAEVLRRYCSGSAFSSRQKSGRLILTFHSRMNRLEDWLEGEGPAWFVAANPQ